MHYNSSTVIAYGPQEVYDMKYSYYGKRDFGFVSCPCKMRQVYVHIEIKVTRGAEQRTVFCTTLSWIHYN